MISGATKLIKWLIFTNLYIAIAAVCFQLVIVILVDHLTTWNWMLSIHTFFSTWLVYQFSRWNFHRNIRDHDYQRDEIYSWLDAHPNFTFSSIVVAGIGTMATVFFLRWQTIYVLAGLGVVSVLYPIRFKISGKEFGVRSIPFAKIFLIAVVWAGISVWAPLSEMYYPPFEHLYRFAFHMLFILFITLPFDIVDIPNDNVTSLQTLPSWLGVNWSKRVIWLIGLMLITYEVLRMNVIGPLIWPYLIGYIVLILMLAVFANKLSEGTDKWKVMMIFDGSMILWFLNTLLLHRYG